MSERVFWADPYLSELETKIASVEGAAVTLEQTIFYAFSGGQESDRGTIGSYPVLTARQEGTQISYELPEGHELSPGDTVLVHIDWERRYRLMRLHFAAELILELMYRKVPHVEKIGAHIAEDKARLDFFLKENISTFFPELLEEAHALILQDLPVTSEFSDRENLRRYWEIEGFARVPCGGTHVKQTGEVGAISMKRKNIGQSKERIEIFLKS